LSEKRNQKHEEKQRDLIKKLSYFQVNNKQLTYEIRKISQYSLPDEETSGKPVRTRRYQNTKSTR
jgi:hypothetical protein